MPVAEAAAATPTGPQDGSSGVAFGYDQVASVSAPPTTFRFALHAAQIAISCVPDAQTGAGCSDPATATDTPRLSVELQIDRFDWQLHRRGDCRSEMETVCSEISLTVADHLVSTAEAQKARPFPQLLCASKSEQDGPSSNRPAPELYYMSASLPDGISTESELVISGGCIFADFAAWRATLALFAYDATADSGGAGAIGAPQPGAPAQQQLFRFTRQDRDASAAHCSARGCDECRMSGSCDERTSHRAHKR